MDTLVQCNGHVTCKPIVQSLTEYAPAGISIAFSFLAPRLLRCRARSAQRCCSVHVKLPSTEPFQSRLFVFTSTKPSTPPAQSEQRITRADTSIRTMAQEVQAPRQPMRGNSPAALLIGSHQQKSFDRFHVDVCSNQCAGPIDAESFYSRRETARFSLVLAVPTVRIGRETVLVLPTDLLRWWVVLVAR